MMKEIIESYFRERSLVNHQLASYNDCIPSADSQSSRFEEIVRNIRIGTEEVCLLYTSPSPRDRG